MRPSQIEAWVLQIVDRVNAGQKVEDSRVELKAEWPEPRPAARRVAGHANASGGEPILWIIGLDEKKGVQAFQPQDVSTWSAQFSVEFDSIAPSLRELNVPTVSGELIALLFDTSRSPYVVKNPAHGQTGGGPVSWEVPWREGTSVRTARREDLLRILVPLESLPHVEVLSGALNVSPVTVRRDGLKEKPLGWSLWLSMYFTPTGTTRIVLPFHHVSIYFTAGDRKRVPMQGIHLNAPDTPTVVTTKSEAVLTGPGKLSAHAVYEDHEESLPRVMTATVELLVRPARSDREIAVTAELKFDSKHSNAEKVCWVFGAEE
ncbi:MAG TPA: hypothetical protein VHI99_02490 [Vicinamibacterales bacterium]|jgi:hypothetical protein|nr:hypothetical protein [Vicinamibacterales bacterium]